MLRGEAEGGTEGLGREGERGEGGIGEGGGGRGGGGRGGGGRGERKDGYLSGQDRCDRRHLPR